MSRINHVCASFGKTCCWHLTHLFLDAVIYYLEYSCHIATLTGKDCVMPGTGTHSRPTQFSVEAKWSRRVVLLLYQQAAGPWRRSLFLWNGWSLVSMVFRCGLFTESEFYRTNPYFFIEYPRIWQHAQNMFSCFSTVYLHSPT